MEALLFWFLMGTIGAICCFAIILIILASREKNLKCPICGDNPKKLCFLCYMYEWEEYCVKQGKPFKPRQLFEDGKQEELLHLIEDLRITFR